MAAAPASPTMTAREWSLLLALSVLWGGSFFFFKILAAEYPAFTVVLGRVGLAAVALNLWLWARGEAMPREPRLWAAFLVMGLLNNVAPYALIVFGETRISSGLASILNATTPIFTVLVAHACTRSEKLTLPKVLGVLFGLAGVAALLGPQALSGLGGDLAGQGACLLAALSYAFAGVYGRRFRGIAPVKVATGQITASALVLLPLTALADHPWTLAPPSAQAGLAFAGISLFCTALAYIVYFRLLAAAGPTNLLLVTFLLPVSATALGALFLGESLSGGAALGLGLIGLGLAAIDGRAPQAAARWRALRRRPAADYGA